MMLFMINLFLRVREKAFSTDQVVLSVKNCNILIISFAFNDAPKTAFIVGGKMPGSIGVKAVFLFSGGFILPRRRKPVAFSKDLVNMTTEGRAWSPHVRSFGYIGTTAMIGQ
jgi:hypothetical protein